MKDETPGAASLVPIHIKDSTRNRGKKKADPPFPKVKSGDRIVWHNDTRDPAIKIKIVFNDGEWPFAGTPAPIEVAVGQSSPPMIVRPHDEEKGYTYGIFDPQGNPVQDPDEGPGDPGVLVGD